jgi:protein disulfide-isomerase A1
LNVAKVDCTLPGLQDFCQENGVSGYPAIKLWREGVSTNYDGSRTEADIIEWALNSSDDSEPEEAEAPEELHPVHDEL